MTRQDIEAWLVILDPRFAVEIRAMQDRLDTQDRTLKAWAPVVKAAIEYDHASRAMRGASHKQVDAALADELDAQCEIRATVAKLPPLSTYGTNV